MANDLPFRKHIAHTADYSDPKVLLGALRGNIEAYLGGEEKNMTLLAAKLGELSKQSVKSLPELLALVDADPDKVDVLPTNWEQAKAHLIRLNAAKMALG